jgi:hypothetical protein
MASLHNDVRGWIFTPPPAPAAICIPIRTEEAEALQRLCPAVRLGCSPAEGWRILAEDAADLADIRAFVLDAIDSRRHSDAWRLRSVAYRLVEAEGL